MGTGGRIASSAVDASFSAVDGFSDHLQRLGDGFRGLRAMLGDSEQSMSVEGFLVALVGTIRNGARADGRSKRDAYSRARRRRRHLGLLSFGAGPLAGVATQLVVLYCEVATVCDLDDVYDLGLSDQQIASEMLLLWSVVEEREEAQAMIDGVADRTVALTLTARLGKHASSRLPAEPTTRGAVEALWRARGALGDARRSVSTGSIRGVIFAGRGIKRFIKRAEAQLSARIVDREPWAAGSRQIRDASA